MCDQNHMFILRSFSWDHKHKKILLKYNFYLEFGNIYERFTRRSHSFYISNKKRYCWNKFELRCDRSFCWRNHYGSSHHSRGILVDKHLFVWSSYSYRKLPFIAFIQIKCRPFTTLKRQWNVLIKFLDVKYCWKNNRKLIILKMSKVF